MNKIRVNKNFFRYSNALLIEKTSSIVAKMTGNTNYPNPDVALTTITTLNTNFAAKCAAAVDGGKIHTAEANKARELLLDALYKLMLYVDRIALGDLAILLSSGFDATQRQSSHTRPDFIVKPNGHDGCVIARHKTDRGIRAWIWQYCADPITPTTWVSVGATAKASTVIKGLKSGTKYWFRACYINKEGQSEWCVPYSTMVI